MPNQSATINVMIQAARKAAKSLLKDFTEVENLQHQQNLREILYLKLI